MRAPVPVWADWPWPDWLFDLARACRRISERARQRRALMDLDDRLLADIGITREDAMRETNLWPWERMSPPVRSSDKIARATATPLISARAGM